MTFKSQDVIAGLPAARVEAYAGHERGPRLLEQFSEPETPNLRDFARVLQARWGLMAMFLAVVLGATLLVSLLVTPTYRGVLTLQIERDMPKVFQFQDVVPVESSADKEFFQTQFELLESRALARRVIERLRLDENPDFLNARLGLRGMLSAWFSAVTARGPSEKTGMEDLIERFLDALQIEPVRNARLVRIAFVSSNRALAVDVANTLADTFIQMQIERRVDASSYAKRFLEERLAQVKVKLEESEKLLVEFARASHIIKLDQNQTIVVEKLRDMASALTAAEQERIAAQALHTQMQRGDSRGIGKVLDNPTVQQLKQHKADLEAQYQDQSKLFKPAYPKMQQLASQIEEIDAKMTQEIGHVRDAVRTDYLVARAKEQSLQREMDRLRQDILTLQDQSIEYNILQREVDTNRQLYDGLLQRMKEIGVAAGITGNNISIVDAAQLPVNPFRPNIPLNMLVALFVGLAGAFTLAFVVDHVDDTIKTPDDLESRARVPTLGVVPEMRAGRGLIGGQIHLATLAFRDPRAPLVEAYRSIRTSLLFSTSHGAPKVMLFTSPGPAEGKTTSAVNIALTFTQTGNKVLLIDADLRNPSLHRVMGLENQIGLTNYLTGDAGPAEVSQYTVMPNLFVIPSGPLPPNPAELLSDEKMVRLLALGAEKFDYVILDGPPVLGLADALVLANRVDGAILVVEAGTTRHGQVQGAVKRLRSAHAKLVGGILAKHRDLTLGYRYHPYLYYRPAEGEQVGSGAAS